MKRMFDFKCEEGHVTERLIDDDIRVISCEVCNKDAHRLVAAPQMKLEGFTGAFLTAYDAWERKRAEKLAIEKKQNS